MTTDNNPDAAADPQGSVDGVSAWTAQPDLVLVHGNGDPDDDIRLDSLFMVDGDAYTYREWLTIGTLEELEERLVANYTRMRLLTLRQQLDENAGRTFTQVDLLKASEAWDRTAEALEALSDTVPDISPPTGGDVEKVREAGGVKDGMGVVSSREHNLENVHTALAEYLSMPEEDPYDAIDVVIAVVIANRTKTVPVWVLLVDPPSGGKTEHLLPVSELPEAYFISTLTPQTFMSGQVVNRKDPIEAARLQRRASLLFRLQDAEKSLLVFKDFTTMLEMRQDSRAEIMSQLREIYDGRVSKPFGTGTEVHWEGHLGILAGVTPVIDKYHAVTSVLGDRFLYLRFSEPDRTLMTLQALDTDDHEQRTKLRDAVTEYVEGVDMSKLPALTESAKKRVVALADFAARARTGVDRDPYARDIIVKPQAERPARIAKQLGLMTRCLMLMGKDEAEALRIVERLAFDSVPPVRMRLIQRFRDVVGLMTNDLAGITGISRAASRRVAEDLVALGLLTEAAGEGSRSTRYDLSQLGRTHFEAVGWTSDVGVSVVESTGSWAQLWDEIQTEYNETIEEDQQ